MPSRTKKTTAVSPAAAPEKVPQAHGGALNRGGTPGNKGGGRPSNAFLQRCLSAVEDSTLWQAAIEKNPNSVLALAASYVHGLPKQAIETTGRMTFEVVLVDGTKRGPKGASDD